MPFFNKKNCKCTFLINSGQIRLEESMIVTLSDWEMITIPKGFVCDCASIPRIAWRLVGHPMHRYNLRAGIVHDFLYQGRTFDRKTCDEIFYEILRSEGKPWITSKLCYHAVRMFGSEHY